VVAILLSTIGNVPIFNRFLNQDVGSLNGRTYLWQAILDHFDPTHLLGYGLKSSDALLANLQVGFGGGVIATSASNLYLQTLYDHGIIGLALLSLIFIVILASLIKGIRRTKGDQRNLFVVGLAVLINMLIECVEVNDLWTQAIGLYFWVIIALPFVRYWTEGEQRGEERRQVLDQVVVPQMKMAQPEVREPVSLSPKL
jgi:O-antigen ligase